MACSNVVVGVEAVSVVVLMVVGFGAEFVGRRLWVVHLDPDGNGWTKDDVWKIWFQIIISCIVENRVSRSVSILVNFEY